MISKSKIKNEVSKITKCPSLDYPFPEGEWESNEYYDQVVSLIKNEGLWLEFGVWSGRTINYFAKKTKNKIYGFDSFLGLPEGNDYWSEGMFNMNGNPPKVDKNVELVVGWFEDTLDNFLTEHDENISFLHVDCDIYSSSKFVLNKLKDRIAKGTVIAFDEIYNYPRFEDHEILAWLEFIKETNLNYEWICRSNKIDDQYVTGLQAACIII